MFPLVLQPIFHIILFHDYSSPSMAAFTRLPLSVPSVGMIPPLSATCHPLSAVLCCTSLHSAPSLSLIPVLPLPSLPLTAAPSLAYCHTVPLLHKVITDRPRWFLRYGVNNASQMCGPDGWGPKATYQRTRNWTDYLHDLEAPDICAPEVVDASLQSLRSMIHRCPVVDKEGPRWDLLRLLAIPTETRLQHMRECTP